MGGGGGGTVTRIKVLLAMRRAGVAKLVQEVEPALYGDDTCQRLQISSSRLEAGSLAVGRPAAGQFGTFPGSFLWLNPAEATASAPFTSNYQKAIRAPNVPPPSYFPAAGVFSQMKHFKPYFAYAFPSVFCIYLPHWSTSLLSASNRCQGWSFLWPRKERKQELAGSKHGEATAYYLRSLVNPSEVSTAHLPLPSMPCSLNGHKPQHPPKGFGSFKWSCGSQFSSLPQKYPRKRL